MRVRVLGPVEVESGNHVIASSVNQRLLVAALAASAGSVVSVDALVTMLWPDDAPQNPSAALQNLVSRLRARTGADAFEAIVTRPPGYSLLADQVSIDSVEFVDQVARARTESDPQSAIDQYRSALGLWRGDAYSEFSHIEGIREHAVHLDELRITSQEELLELVVHREAADGVAELERLVARHPHRERPRALLMEALYRSLRQADALAVFAEYRKELADELGLEPSPELRALEHAILTDSFQSGPQAAHAKALVDHDGNLPRRRISVVGRDAEVAEIVAGIGTTRLLTICGSGGVGKTTVALEVGRATLPRFDDGVWVADLVTERDPVGIVEHIAAVLDLPPVDHPRSGPELAAAVADRRLLLVLDNCEHLLAAVARVVDALLDHADGVHVLCTSREPIRVQGELVHRLRPLDVPTPSDSGVTALATSAGRLFADRARLADPGLALDDASGRAVGRICRRLGGLPLALELAAARASVLDLDTLADRLDDRLDLLDAGSGPTSDHHRTLRAAIEWSIDLLSVDEREVLPQLSVFVGGFDLDAAERVCTLARSPSTDIASVVVSLVDKSLVNVDPRGGYRYDLFDPVREIVAETLGDERQSVERRHLASCQLVARAIGDEFAQNGRHWNRQLRLEWPNLRRGFHWAMDHGQVESALDLAGSLRWAPESIGHHFAEHASWLTDALDAARSATIDGAVSSRALIAAGCVAGLDSRPAEALSLLREALPGAAPGLDEMHAWLWIGAFSLDTGDWGEAESATARGLAIAEQLGWSAAIVEAANHHAEAAGVAARLLDEPQRLATARASYLRARAVAHDHDMDDDCARAELGLALLDLHDDPARCLDVAERSISAWEELDAAPRLIHALVATARVAIVAGDLVRAGELARSALDRMSEVGWSQPLGRLLEAIAVLRVRDGDLDDAALLCGAADTVALSQRSYVDIDADATFAQARYTDPRRWDEGIERGRSLGHDELRRLADETLDRARGGTADRD
jgi:predicted ATPase/DNA-binding SARP family transcriptional activator